MVTQLPNELQIAIIDNLYMRRDLAACAQTCVAWSAIASARLYRLGYRDAVTWALGKGDNRLLDRIRAVIEDSFLFEDLSLAIINDNTEAAEAILSSSAARREWEARASWRIRFKRPRDRYGRVPLVAAAVRRNKHLVERILALPTVVHSGADEVTRLALSEACSFYPRGMDKTVAEYRSNQNLRPFSWRHDASPPPRLQHREPDLDIVRILLDAGHNTAGGVHGPAPLFVAAKCKRVDIMQLLLSRGADPNFPQGVDENRLPLMGAASVEGNVEAVRLLLKHGANISRVGWLSGSSLHCAADAAIAAELLEAGLPIEHRPARHDILRTDMSGMYNAPQPPFVTPLMAAIESKRPKAALFFLERGADPNATDQWGYDTLGAAAWADMAEVVPALVKAGLDPLLPGGQKHMCARQLVVHRDSLGVLKEMIALGVDFKALPKEAAPIKDLGPKGHAHRMPICLALNLATFDLLAEHSGDFNDRIGPRGETVFMQAMIPRGDLTRDVVGWRVIVRRYVELGADLEAVDGSGQTVLHKAVLFSDEGRVEELVDLGADINRQDSDGWTPLMLACKRRHVDNARALIIGGANMTGIVRGRGESWESALDMAVRLRLTRVVRDILFCEPDTEAAIARCAAKDKNFLMKRIRAVQCEEKHMDKMDRKEAHQEEWRQRNA